MSWRAAKFTRHDFTGLLDKNGRGIREGDLVEIRRRGGSDCHILGERWVASFSQELHFSRGERWNPTPKQVSEVHYFPDGQVKCRRSWVRGKVGAVGDRLSLEAFWEDGTPKGAVAGLGDRPGAVEARRLCCPPVTALRRMRRNALRQMLGGNRNSGVPRGGVNFSGEAGGLRPASLPRRWTWVDPPLWATYLRGRWRRRQTSGRGRCA